MGEAALATTLRRHRRAAGLSQERLAERSGVSVRTIRNIESGRVTAPRFASVGALADALGLDTAQRARFNQLCAGNEHEPGPGAQPERDGWVPAPLTPLVGRAADVADLIELLSAGTAPLVTLAGVAGVGKSRLAMEVARRLQQQGRPTWWVPLASVGDVRYVLDAIAHSVGAPTVSTAGVAARLRGGAPLLALDNLEHLDGMGELLAELSGAVPSLTVLATSRAPVGVPGEQEWLVRPLAVPMEDEADPAVVATVESAQLLVERVGAVIPGFELADVNARVVAEICRLLDGLPLAVELAARQWRVRGGAGLARSIRRDLLGLRDISDTATNQHASLRDALDASSALLEDPVEHTFGCLSVFPAGWNFEAGAAVADSADTVDHLDRLVALGLVVRSVADSTAEPRFSMLPTIRAFASMKARETTTAEPSRARHAEHFRKWVVRSSAADGPPSDLLEKERDNLRAALDWFRAHDPPAGLETAIALCPHWFGRGREIEGLAHFEGLLIAVDGDRAEDAALVATARQRAAGLALVAGDDESAARLATEAQAAFQELGDPRGSAEALGTLGMASRAVYPLSAVAHCEAAVAQAEPLGDVDLLAWLLECLGACLIQLGRLTDATAALGRARELASEPEQAQVQMGALVSQAYILAMQEDVLAAHHLLDEGAPLVATAGGASLEVFWLALRAGTSAQIGQLDPAAALVASLDRKAAETGSLVIRTLADLSLGELKLAEGASGEAAAALRRALANPALGMPLRRVTLLAALALAVDDMETAARAVSAAIQIADRCTMHIPPVPAGRLAATAARWKRLAGANEWSDRIKALSDSPLDDLLRAIVGPQRLALGAEE